MKRLGSPWLARLATLTLRWLAACLLAAAAGSGPPAPARAADTIARCEPVAPTGPMTSQLAVDLYVENAVDLYGVDLRLTFDTGVAQVVDADAGLAGVQLQPLNDLLTPGFVVRKVADNTAGTVWYAITQLNPQPPANGSGPVARVTFTPTTYGAFNFNFTYVRLADRDGNSLPVVAQNCTVAFTTPAPTTTGLNPASAVANGPAFTLAVSGTNFIDGSVVHWNGSPRPTTYVSGSLVTADIPAADLTTAGPVPVTVVNPAPGGGTSNAQTFTVQTHVHFDAAAYSVDEFASTAQITAVLDAPSSVTVTVNFAATDGTAGAGDYTPVSIPITFAPGSLSQNVPIVIANDLLDELDETINLALSAPANALLGTPNTASLTIVDDDAPPEVFFSSAAYSLTESAGAALIGISLSAASGLTVTVAYSTSDGTATAGDDFTPLSGTLTFAPGATTQAFVLPVLDDDVAEPNETVALSLSNPTNAALGAPSTAAFTILDDEGLPTVSFSSADYFATEDAGTATLTATLSAESAVTVTVDYNSGGGTAGDSDYDLPPGTLEFAPGVLTQTVTVTILEDALFEPNETVPITLSNPMNAGLGTPASAILTILDDEPFADLMITKSAVPAAATAGTVLTYTLTITNNGPSPVSNIVVTDALPAGVSLLDTTGACTGGANLTCNLAGLSSGTHATIQLRVSVNGSTRGALVNNAGVSAAVADPNPANNTASLTTPVNAAANLALSKTAAPSPVRSGERLTYTLIVTNSGPSTATNVALTDSLPISVTVAGLSPGCAAADGMVTCSLGTLNSGSSRTITITAVPNVSAASVITNTARVGSAEADPVPGNNSASVAASVLPSDFRLYLPLLKRS